MLDVCKNVCMHAQLSIVIETQSSGEFHRENEKCTVCNMANFARNEVGSYDLNMVLRRVILVDLRRAGNSGR